MTFGAHTVSVHVAERSIVFSSAKGEMPVEGALDVLVDLLEGVPMSDAGVILVANELGY